MRKGKGKIALEGLPYIGVLGLIAWITALFGFTILSLIFGALALFTLYFFRDPERETPKEPYAVIAPADGRVIEVERSLEGDFLNREMMRIGIFLSVTDCHINRFPVTGRVIGTRYIPGGFKKAYLESASKENERLATLVETEDKDEIVIVQVAGFIARRIVSYVSPGDVVERGERFGMIKFGSRVDLYLPLRCEVTAAVGDRVRGGETIIGWLKEKEA